MQKISFTIVLLSIFFVVLTTPAIASKVLVMPTGDVPVETLEMDFLYHRGLNSLGAQIGFYPGLSAGLRQDFGGQLYATVKAAIIEETQNRPAFALGGELSVNRTHLYAAVSKQLGNPSLRGHVAFGLGRYSRGMAGMTLMLNPVKVNNAPTTSLFMEYDGQGINGGLIARFSPELKANLGIAFGHGLSAGLNYKVAF